MSRAKRALRQNSSGTAAAASTDLPSTEIPAISLPEPSTRLLWLCRFTLLAAIVLAYSNSFAGAFVFDDHLTIIESTDLHRLSDWQAIFVGREADLPVRAFPYFTFALNYALDGANPRFYHLVNLLIHVGCAWLAFDLLRWTLATPRLAATFGRAATGIAWSAVLLWSVHPLQTMAITYVYQRMESLMALCYLATWWCFVVAMQSRQKSMGWWALSVACCFLGMASKEVMITAPLLILWYDRVFWSRSWQEIREKRAWYYASLVATSAVLFLVMYSQRGRYAEFAGMRHSGLIYLMNQPRVLLLYAKLIFWPMPQCIDYNWPMSYQAREIIPALLPVTLAVAWLLANLIKRPIVAFAFGSVFLVLSVTSSVVAVQDLVMEHRMYLPSLLLITALVAAFAWMISKVAASPAASAKDSPLPIVSVTWPRAALACTLVLAILLGIRTYVRNQDYRSYEGMWQQVLEVDPLSRRARTKWVATLTQQKELPRLLEEAKALVEKFPNEPVPLLVLAEAYNLNKQWAEVLPIATQVLGSPDHQDEAHYLIASSYSAMQQSDRAVEHYRQAVLINPIFLRAWHSLGREMAMQDRLDDAIICFRKAIAVKRFKSDALQDLALALDMKGESKEAEALFQEYLRFNPNHVSARTNYADLLRRAGRLSEARTQLQEALTLQPNSAPLHAQLASIHTLQKDSDAAQAQIDKALEHSQELTADNAETWIFLAELLLQRQQPAQAMSLLEKASAEPTVGSDAARRIIRLRLDRAQTTLFDPQWVADHLNPASPTTGFSLTGPERSFWVATAQLELNQPAAATQAAEAGLREIQSPQDGLWRPRLQQVLAIAKQRLPQIAAPPTKS